MPKKKNPFKVPQQGWKASGSGYRSYSQLINANQMELNYHVENPWMLPQSNISEMAENRNWNMPTERAYDDSIPFSGIDTYYESDSMGNWRRLIDEPEQGSAVSFHENHPVAFANAGSVMIPGTFDQRLDGASTFADGGVITASGSMNNFYIPVEQRDEFTKKKVKKYRPRWKRAERRLAATQKAAQEPASAGAETNVGGIKRPMPNTTKPSLKSLKKRRPMPNTTKHSLENLKKSRPMPNATKPSLENLKKRRPMPNTTKPSLENLKKRTKMDIQPKAIKMTLAKAGFPTARLSKKDADSILQEILNKSDQIPENGQLPKILSCKFRFGTLTIECEDTATVEWLTSNYHDNDSILSGETISVLSANELPKSFIVSFRTEDVLTRESKVLLKRLNRFNPKFKCMEWQVLHRTVEGIYCIWIFEVDLEAFNCIKEAQFKAYTGIDRGNFIVLWNPNGRAQEVGKKETKQEEEQSENEYIVLSET